ncbi:MAG: glutamate racemase [Actinomycetia bacterium]|nr:glutamate racemase [Actinomycetes bacterium]
MATIAIFDSGIGGTTVHDAVRERAPWADIVYVADHAFGPYGERSLEEVRARTEVLARYLASAGVEAIVIACNSASAAALQYLRASLPEVAFVGMEPAVKPAASATTAGVVGVMATGATFQGELFRSLVGKHAEGVEIIEQACPGLAAAIEHDEDVGPLLDRYLAPIIEAEADVVVLGCTHYPLIRDAIERRLPAGVEIVDPTMSVARRVLDVAHDTGIDLEGTASTRWWTTAPDEDRGDDRDWETIDIPKSGKAAIRVCETTVVALVGDLTAMPVAAIVNAANVELRHGGGIALAIARAGGPMIDEESHRWIETYGPLEPGVAALTSAGEMPSSYVIHVAGPIHTAGQDNEGLLAAGVFAALDMATEIEVKTIALPAVSAGVYGYPPDEATLVIAESTAEFLEERETTLRSVRLVGFDDAMATRFAEAIASLTDEV